MYDSYDGILMYTTVFFVLALSQPLGLPYADPSKTPSKTPCLQPSGLKVTTDWKIHGNSGSLRPNIHKNLKMSKHKWTIKTNHPDISQCSKLAIPQCGSFTFPPRHCSKCVPRAHVFRRGATVRVACLRRFDWLSRLTRLLFQRFFLGVRE